MNLHETLTSSTTLEVITFIVLAALILWAVIYAFTGRPTNKADVSFLLKRDPSGAQYDVAIIGIAEGVTKDGIPGEIGRRILKWLRDPIRGIGLLTGDKSDHDSTETVDVITNGIETLTMSWPAVSEIGTPYRVIKDADPELLKRVLVETGSWDTARQSLFGQIVLSKYTEGLPKGARFPVVLCCHKLHKARVWFWFVVSGYWQIKRFDTVPYRADPNQRLWHMRWPWIGYLVLEALYAWPKDLLYFVFVWWWKKKQLITEWEPKL